MTLGIVVFGVFAALLEGVGLSFIVPIIELARSGGSVDQAGGILGAFAVVYGTLNIPLTLESAIFGVSLVMIIRYTSSFLVSWCKASLRTNYERYLKKQAFKRTLSAEISYFDKEGSDNILNSIITEARFGGAVIRFIVEGLQTLFLMMMYLFIAFYIAPLLTLFTILVLGGSTYLTRNVLEPGYDLGDHVSDANERVQKSVQAGTQGVRDVKLFGLSEELFSDFKAALDQFTRADIKRLRNRDAINSFYNLVAALTVFGLIYLAFRLTSLTLGALGLFLFAMFRLSPLVSQFNSKVYQTESYLSHLIRTQEFIEELKGRAEPVAGRDTPHPVNHIEFDDVYFSYNDEEQVIKGFSFEIRCDEFIGFVGQSGAGKSTIVSLLTRIYEPDGGKILANDIPIDDIDIRKWRQRLAVVRQNPYIFNDTLRNNITIGNRGASDDEIQEVSRIARIDEFLDELPRGMDTLLGEDGVRLSGGQRQRVAIARALLKDADVLVLDEATSDLDSNLEREVQEAIESMERDYAMIAIAHRLSTVRNADRIYTVEEGRITEVGKHEELLDRGGKYAELHSIQTQET